MIRSDETLIENCLAGDQSAWSVLVARYKNLVYSVPVRYRLSPEDAADVFQAVWLELFNELGRLRHSGALRSWLITVAARKCYHLKRRRQSRRETTEADLDLDRMPENGLPPEWQAEAEQQQVLRLAMEKLNDRCRTLVQLLFFEDPPLPYAEVARRLGLAEGSIGFIRGRCLQKLRRNLEEIGF